MRSGTMLALAALLLGAACGDDDGAAPSKEELTGAWRATKIEVVSVANPTQKLDLITIGVTATLVLEAKGTFLMTTTEPGRAAETLAGTWSASKDVLTMNWTVPFNGEWQFDMSLSGDALTLSGADSEFNIDGQGGDDPVKMNLTFTRQ